MDTAFPSIAYLIVAHNNPDQLARLIDHLSHPNVVFFVHIDKHHDVNPFKIRFDNRKDIVFLENRNKVFYRGFLLVEAILKLMRAAILVQAKHYVLLSGSDYPIKTNKEILAFLKNSTKEYLHFFLLTERPSWLSQIYSYHYLDSYFSNSIRGNATTRKIYLKVKRALDRLEVKRTFPEGLTPYGGSAWWMLTHSCIKYLLENVDENKRIIRFFRYTDCPDEMVFQTMLLNSDLKEKMANFLSWLSYDNRETIYSNMTPSHPLYFSNFNYRYIDWTIERQPFPGSPAVLDERDFEKIRSSDCLFARKFDPVKSAILLDRIDAEILGM